MEREVIIASTEENGAVLENGEVINLPIKTANAIAQTYLENISSDDLYEAEAALKDLNALVQRVIQQTIKAGDADDWHNFAVDIARKDLYDLACDLLECGLSIWVLPRWLLHSRPSRKEPQSLRKQPVISMPISIFLCGRSTERRMLIR